MTTLCRTELMLLPIISARSTASIPADRLPIAAAHSTVGRSEALGMTANTSRSQSSHSQECDRATREPISPLPSVTYFLPPPSHRTSPGCNSTPTCMRGISSPSCTASSWTRAEQSQSDLLPSNYKNLGVSISLFSKKRSSSPVYKR